MAANDLLNEFSDFGVTPAPNILEKCLDLMNKYGVSSETFVNCWLGYSTTKLQGEGPTLDTLVNFDKEVLSKEKSSKSIKKEPTEDSPVIHNITTINQIAEDDELLGGYGTPARKPSVGAKRSALEGTPQNKRLAGLGQTPGTVNKFSTRTNAGEVVVKYPTNNTDVITWSRSDETWKPNVRLYGAATLTSESKYMFSRLRDKYEILEDQIDSFTKALAEKFSIEEFSRNNKVQSDTFHTIGRICCDATSGARLNASSLLLEGSKEMSSGQSVPLDVSHVKEYSFFPGQVVAVEGSNPTGKKIVVTAVSAPPIPPMVKSDIGLQGPLNVIVACGPFTLIDDLEFTPLQELIEQINTILPHLVILMGPFLDAKNKKIESGELDRTHQEEFDQFLEKLQGAIFNSVQVVIVSSWRDVHHRTIYPTPPFSSKKKQPNFQFLPDPCILNVDGVLIALTSTDILFHLSKEEIAVVPTGSDRMGRLVSHLFSQQSFYPLSPPSEEMSIDLELAEEHGKLPFTPHVLITSSELRYFIKNVQGCVAVNTERIVKGYSGGTYARMQIKKDGANIQVKAEVLRI
nr:EOG090X07VJ [Macrothrix elegans]